jgi:arsenate reductase-like glutaredoxin family protein
MNLQIYYLKKNFDTQKALRFLKERRIAFQEVNLQKHRLGKRELDTFAKGNIKSLIDFDNPKVKEHPIAYTGSEEKMAEILIENPQFLRTPIIRSGQKSMIGFDEQMLLSWLT